MSQKLSRFYIVSYPSQYDPQVPLGDHEISYMLAATQKRLVFLEDGFRFRGVPYQVECLVARPGHEGYDQLWLHQHDWDFDD